jgi:hypothetical protein
LSFSKVNQIGRRVGHGFGQLRMFGVIFLGAVQKLVGQFFKALKTKVRAAEHQQGCHRPRQKRADRQRRRHQNQLVDERALGHSPDHRQLAFGAYARYLLGVERQIVAQYAGGFLRRHLGHQRNVVEYRGDIVDQHQKTASCHECFPVPDILAEHSLPARLRSAFAAILSLPRGRC